MQNGNSSMENGAAAHSSNTSLSTGSTNTSNRLGPQHLINKHEFLRIIEQALYSMGYAVVAKTTKTQTYENSHVVQSAGSASLETAIWK